MKINNSLINTTLILAAIAGGIWFLRPVGADEILALKIQVEELQAEKVAWKFREKMIRSEGAVIQRQRDSASLETIKALMLLKGVQAKPKITVKEFEKVDSDSISDYIFKRITP